MSDPASNRRDDDGVEVVNEPPNKQIKLDPGTHKSECEVPTSKTKIEDLPDEVIVMILSYYSFTELIENGQNVCTQWRRASHDPLLWHNKEYCVGYDVTDDEVLAILRRVPQLRNLEINRHVRATVIQAVCKNCKQLNYLNIEHLKRINLNLLKKLVASCRNIKALKISAELLHDENNAVVLARLTLLKSLTILGSNSETIHLGALAKGCPNLSKLKLNRIRTKDVSQLIEAKCKILSHLELPWIGDDNRLQVPLLKNCTALYKLGLFGVSKTSGELIQAFSTLAGLPNLRSLRLMFSYSEVPEQAFRSAKLLHLEVLKIDDIYLQNSVLLAISEGFPNLKELHLDECYGHDGGDFKELYRFKKLETLAVKCRYWFHGEALLHLSRVPSLRKLLLENFDFRKVKNGLPLILDIHSLEILSFTSIKFIYLFPFNRISETLINLRILNVVESELDIRILEKLKNQMPDLQVYAPNNVDKNELRKMKRIMKL